MSKPSPLIDSKGEVREITSKDVKMMRNISALPGSLQRKIGQRGEQKNPTKERITIRLSRDVVERFRATGDGWQTRVDAALQDWLSKHKPTA